MFRTALFVSALPTLLIVGCSAQQQSAYLDLSTFTEIPQVSEAQAEQVLSAAIAKEDDDCYIDPTRNVISDDDGPFLPYADWEATFHHFSSTNDIAFSLASSTASTSNFHFCHYFFYGDATYDDVNAFLAALQTLDIPLDNGYIAGLVEIPMTASEFPRTRASSEFPRTGTSGFGIGRAIAGVATGAVMADALVRGADPEDVAQLGSQVIDIIDGDTTTTAAPGQDSGFQGFELPDENRREAFGDSPSVARVTQSAGGGQCDFPWMLDGSPPPAEITAIRLSWCNAPDTMTRIHLRANAAATQQCQLVYWRRDDRPAADIDGLAATIRQQCAYADGESAMNNVNCRCPSWYGQ